MHVYGELVRAQLEILTSDPSAGAEGRVWFNNTSRRVGLDYDGATAGNLLDNLHSLNMKNGFTVTINGTAADVAFTINTAGNATFPGTVTIAGSVVAAAQLSMTLSAGVFTIAGADGTALSASNPAYILMSAAAGSGTQKQIQLTSNFTLRDSASTSSDMIGEEFGTTTGVAWGNARPFYLYAVNTNDTTAGFFFALSPNPRARFAPDTANIGWKGVPAGTPNDINFFFLSSTTATAADGLPCKRLGGFTMTKNTADDWAIGAITQSAGSGFREDPFVGQVFAMPTGQMGAGAGVFLTSTGPTWASPSSIVYNYQMNLDGKVDIYFSTEPAGSCTNGSTGVVRLHLPYSAVGIDGLFGPTLSSYAIPGAMLQQAGIKTLQSIRGQLGGNKYVTFGLSTDSIDNNAFTSTDDNITVNWTLPVF